MKNKRALKTTAIVAVCAGALLLGASAPAGAATVRWAAPAAVGDPTVCSLADPCSLANALSSSDTADGDEVILMPGVYSPATAVGINHAMDVHGTGAPSATEIDVTGSPAYGIQVNSGGATLRNVTISDSSSANGAIHVIVGTLRNAVVTSSSSYACAARIAMIRDAICVSHVNGHAGVAIDEGGPGSASTVLRNVTAIGDGGSSAVGVMVYGGGSLTATIDGIGVIARGGDYDVSAATDGTGTSNLTLAHSNYATRYQGTNGTVTDPATNSNQTAAPIFVNAASGDFHEAAGSPTIDAGALDAFSGFNDVDGDARTIGGAPDIGGDEYAPPAATAPADTTAPNTWFKKKPRATTAKRRAKFVFATNEANVTFLCKLDRHAYKTCDSQLTVKVKPGRHVLRVLAVDAAGNADSTPAICRWRVLRA